MPIPDIRDLPFDDPEALETITQLMAMLLPVDHPMQQVINTLTMLIARSNDNPDCPECIALTGFLGMAMLHAPEKEMPRLKALCAVTSEALSHYDHQAVPNG